MAAQTHLSNESKSKKIISFQEPVASIQNGSWQAHQLFHIFPTAKAALRRVPLRHHRRGQQQQHRQQQQQQQRQQQLLRRRRRQGQPQREQDLRHVQAALGQDGNHFGGAGDVRQQAAVVQRLLVQVQQGHVRPPRRSHDLSRGRSAEEGQEVAGGELGHNIVGDIGPIHRMSVGQDHRRRLRGLLRQIRRKQGIFHHYFF